MKRVSAIFDTYVEQSEREEGDIRVSMVHIIDNGNCSFSWGVAFLRVDKIGYFEVEGEVGLIALLWINGIFLNSRSA